MTLASLTLVTGQRYRFAESQPSTDFFQSGNPHRKDPLLVRPEQGLEIRRGFETLTESRFDSKLWQMFVANADPGACSGERVLRKAVLAADGVASNVAQQGHALKKQRIEIALQCSPFVADGQKSRRGSFGTSGFDPIKCGSIVPEHPLCNFTANRVIWILAVGFCNERIPSQPAVAMRKCTHRIALGFARDVLTLFGKHPTSVVVHEQATLDEAAAG